MTLEELKAKLAVVLREVPMDGPLDVFVSILNTEDGDGACMGMGCSGCHTKVIARLQKDGFYQHSHERLHPEDMKRTH